MNSENNAVLKKTLDLFSVLTGKGFNSVEVNQLNRLYRMVIEAQGVGTGVMGEAARQAITTGHSAILVDPAAVPAVKLLEDVYKEPELKPKPVPLDTNVLGLRTYTELAERWDAPAAQPDQVEEDDKEIKTVLRTGDSKWRPGYFFKIMVTYRASARYHDAYTMHFVERPSQEVFDSHFQLFLNGECYVYAMQGDGKFTSWGITHEYTKHIDANGKVVNEKPVETFDADENWPDDKQWRIKFFDVRIGKLNYIYFAYQPSGMTLAKYHRGKVFAVAEQRPS